MKRIFTIFSLVLCTCAVAVSCGSNNSKSNDNSAAETAVTEVEQVEAEPAADENRVYSCAFDGYTNIRQEASSKAAAIGKLKNGPEGAEFLGLEGEWTKVSLDGVEGYVFSKYLTDKPTKAVTIDVSADWLEGIWTENDYSFYLVFNNGKYVVYSINFNEGGYTEKGTWMLEEDGIKFTCNWNFVEDSASSEETFLKINPSGTIGEMKRVPYTSEEEYKQIMKEAEEEGMSIDCFLMTKSEFKGLKKTF